MPLRRILNGCFFLAAVVISGPVLAQGMQQPQGADTQSIDRRIDKLEEQIVDLQSQAAALESLANNTGPSTGGGGMGGSDPQMQALSSQVADMIQRLQQIERQLGVTPPPRAAYTPPPVTAQPPSQFRDQGYGAPQIQPQNFSGDRPLSSGGFGSTTVEPQTSAGGSLSSEPPRRFGSQQAANPQIGASPYGGSDVQPARFSSGEAKALYDQAYGSLVKREYQAAETYFTQFLRQHSDDPLAGPAQFWLGETAFVSGEYKQSAEMFLKSYTNFPASEKAPESLLKLGISLKRLGETKEACNAFSELEQRFPQAQAVVQRAQAEKRRSNC